MRFDAKIFQRTDEGAHERAKIAAFIFIGLLLYGVFDATVGEYYRRSQPKEDWPWGDVGVVILRVLENGTRVWLPQEYVYNTSIRRWEVHVTENNTTSIHVLDRSYSR